MPEPIASIFTPFARRITEDFHTRPWSSPKSSFSAAFSSISVLMSVRKPSACSELSERMIS